MNRIKKAFTLIELLTVIAIIGILAAILIPVVGAVRDSARNAQCISNLRQLGLASSLFENDYGHLPWGIFPDHHGGGWWPIHLIPYVEGQDRLSDRGAWSAVHECPSRVILPQEPGVEYAMTYAANRTIFVVGSEAEGRLDVSPISTEMIQRPSEVILLGDGTQRTVGDSNSTFNSLPRTGNPREANSPLPIGPDTDPSNSGTWPRYRHNGKANFVFVDGHVAAINKGDLLGRHLFWDF